MKNKVKNSRLPFGLCIKYGIAIKKHWTPTDAWEALKKKTGKSMVQFFVELSKEELETASRVQIYKKNKDHPKELTSAVFDKIKLVREQLDRNESVKFSLTVGNTEYKIKLFNKDFDYDYEILRSEELE